MTVAVAGFALFLSASLAPSSAPATPLASKRAQAAKLNAEVQRIERQADELQERYRGQQIELEAIQSDIAQARIEVASTRHSLGVARHTLTGRATAIYRHGSADTRLVDVAMSGGFSQFFDKLDTIKRVGDQDSSILVRVDTLNKRVEAKRAVLARNLARQSKVVAAAKRSKAKVDAVLEQRRATLSGVNSEIRAIMEQQRAAAAAKAAAAARETAALARTTTAAPSVTDGGAAPGSAPAPAPSSSSDSSGSGVSIPLPPGSSTAAAAANAAMGKLGSPYVWAASGPDSFDCSGLVIWAFAQAGRPGLPHSTYSLVNMGVNVPLDQLQVGDLVFPAGDGHVGIYVGGGSFVHAPHTGDVVKVTSMSSYTMDHARRL